MIGTDLDDYRKVRSRLARGNYADDVSINDVVLATISGAFRAWLLTRGEAVHSGTTVRAMVPISMYDAEANAGGSRLTACFVTCRWGSRVRRCGCTRSRSRCASRWRAARRSVRTSLAGLAGFAPPTLHSLGARLGSAMSRRLFNVVITNVPGPQHTLYAGDAKMLSHLPRDAARQGAGAVHRPDVLRRRGLLRAQRRPRLDARRRRARAEHRRLARPSCSTATGPRPDDRVPSARLRGHPSATPRAGPRGWRGARSRVDGGGAEVPRGPARHGRAGLRRLRRDVRRCGARRSARRRGASHRPARAPAGGCDRRRAARRPRVGLRERHRRGPARSAPVRRGVTRAVAAQRPPPAPAAAHRHPVGGPARGAWQPRGRRGPGRARGPVRLGATGGRVRGGAGLRERRTGAVRA